MDKEKLNNRPDLKEEDISNDIEILELEIEEESDQEINEDKGEKISIEDREIEPVVQVIEEKDVSFDKKEEKQLATSSEEDLPKEDITEKPPLVDVERDLKKQDIKLEDHIENKERLEEIPKYPEFVIEVKDRTYILGGDVGLKDRAYLFTGANVLDNFSLDNYPRHLFYIAHFDNSDVGVITLEGNIKYAYILTKKKLQEQGILLEDQELIILNKRKLSPTEMEVLYETIPKEKYLQLKNRSLKTREGFILFDYFTMLYGLFLKEKETKAYVLHCENEVCLLAGTKKHVFLAKKFNIVEGSVDTLEEIMISIGQEIENHPLGENITQIEWIEGFSFEPYVPNNISEDMTLIKWPVCEFNISDKKIYTSFPFLLNKIDLKASFSPTPELIALKIQRIEKKILSVASIMLIGVITLVFFLYQTNIKLEHQIVPLQERISQLKNELYSLQTNLLHYSPSEFKDIKDFAKELKIATYSPKIVTLLNSLSALKPSQVYVRGLKISYGIKKIEFIEEGNIDADVISAQTIFNNYILNLEKKGYIVTSKYLNLNMDSKDFKLTFYYYID